MNRIVEILLDKVIEASSLDQAKAYADAVKIVMRQESVCQVHLEGFVQGRQIELIKYLREVFQLGLREAKDMSEQGKKFAEMSIEAGEKFAQTLRDHGGKVKLI